MIDMKKIAVIIGVRLRLLLQTIVNNPKPTLTALALITLGHLVYYMIAATVIEAEHVRNIEHIHDTGYSTFKGNIALLDQFATTVQGPAAYIPITGNTSKKSLPGSNFKYRRPASAALQRRRSNPHIPRGINRPHIVPPRRNRLDSFQNGVRLQNGWWASGRMQAGNINNKIQCTRLKLATPGQLFPKTALATFPGSGNTWTRHLIQQLTGYLTGSVYNDLDLRANGFPGEYIQDGRVIAIKTHLLGIDELSLYSRSVIVIRSPYDALVAEFNRRAGGHTGFSNITVYHEKWSSYLEKEIPHWYYWHIDWLVGTNNSKLILFYEDMVKDLKPILPIICSFLNMTHVCDEKRVQCVLGNSTGNFKRSKNKTLPIDLFDEKNREKMEFVKIKVFTLLKTCIRYKNCFLGYNSETYNDILSNLQDISANLKDSCTHLQFAWPKLPRTVLATLEAIDVNKSKWLVQNLTGYYTSSHKFDRFLFKRGMPGGIAAQGRLILTATNKRGAKEGMRYQKVILLIRSPYDAALALYSRFAQKDMKEHLDWDRYIPRVTMQWHSFYTDWLRFGKETLIISIEDLKKDTKSVLRQICKFLDVEHICSHDRMQCALKSISTSLTPEMHQTWFKPYTEAHETMISFYARNTMAEILKCVKDGKCKVSDTAFCDWKIPVYNLKCKT